MSAGESTLAHAETRFCARMRDPGLPAMLAVFAALVVCWTIYSAVTEAPVAIKHDMAEAYSWGIEWQLGYHQHPWFWAWVCGAWFRVFPTTGWDFAALSSVNAAVGLWGAWATIGNFAQGAKRMAAWALLLLTPLYTFYGYKYNANIIFLSIWPWMLHSFVQSLRGRGRGADVAFGVTSGFALMSKYYALLLIAACGLAALQHPRFRRYIASPAPYVAAAVTALICAPHVAWLLTHHAPPIEYLEDISDRGWPHVLSHIWRSVSGAVGMNLSVAACVGFAVWRWGREPSRLTRSDMPFLATLALAPFVLTVLAALVLRNTLTPEMMVGIFPLLPLLLIELARPRDVERLCRVTVILALTLTLGAAAVSPLVAWMRTYWSPIAMKVTPVQEVAAAATRLWHAETGTRLEYVAASPWYDITTSFYSPDHPHAFPFFDFSRSLWVTPGRLRRHGLLTICLVTDRTCLKQTARFAGPDARRTTLTLRHRFWGHLAGPYQFVFTVIPPRR